MPFGSCGALTRKASDGTTHSYNPGFKASKSLYSEFSTPIEPSDLRLFTSGLSNSQSDHVLTSFLLMYTLQILEELYVMKLTANNIDNRRHYLFMYYIVEFLSLNGMRIGELLAIENENVDLINKKLTIDGTIQRKANSKGQYGVKDTTKNLSSYRTIDLTNRSCEILKSCMLENKKAIQWDTRYTDRNFIFTNYRGNPIYFHRVNEALEKARINLNIKNKITTHTLRHTHISFLTQMGISLKTIMDRVGHSDYRTTLGIYTHVTNQMKNELINKLEDIEQKELL